MDLFTYLASCRSQCSCCLGRGSAAARLLELRFRIPLGVWMVVSCECCVLSGRGLCFGLTIRPEDSYRMWCVCVWLWSLDNERSWPTKSYCATKRSKVRQLIKIKYFLMLNYYYYYYYYYYHHHHHHHHHCIDVLQLFVSVVLRPKAGHGLLIPDDSRSHTTKHHTR